MIPDLRLNTLGGLHLAGASGPLRGAAAQRRSLALLAAIALAQTLYRVRQELGPEVVTGGDRLRLDPERLSVDLFELDDAVAQGDADRAVALYQGPFLDGFGLAGVPELSRWIDEERARVAARYADVLGRAASAADAAGDLSGAARWRRALLAVNPLDARVVVQLMRALAAAGDSAGALQVARIHEALVHQELDVAADPIVAAAVASLRDLPSSATPAPAAPRAIPASSGPTSIDAVPSPAAPATRPSGAMRIVVSRRVVRRVAIAAGVVAITVLGVLAAKRHYLARPVRLAVGDIVDLTGGDSLRAARALPELLTAGLGRFQPLEVVSRARLYDVATQLGAAPEPRELARTARQAGAELLVVGALYRRPDRTFRLDLQLLDLARGTVRASYQLEGADAFALAEIATARVAGDVGASRRVTDPDAWETTRSLTALQLYEQGLRIFYSGDGPSAERLFSAALAEDSTFAMAAYFAYRSVNGVSARAATHLAQAMRHAGRATERERLIIRATGAAANFDPARLALAETLAARFPGEPVAHVLLGDALVETSGDYAGARVAFRQAFAMDSLGLHDGVTRCSACDAMNGLILAYLYADSLDSAEREAEKWTARQPSSAAAWLALASVRAMRGDSARATAAFRMRRSLVPYAPESLPFAVTLALRAGDFARAERLLDNVLQTGTRAERAEARWWLATTQRYEGRLGDALETSRQLVLDDPMDATNRLLHAQVLFEAGRAHEALAEFDSAGALLRALEGNASLSARRRAWWMAHRVTVLAAMGDTARIAALMEPLRTVGAGSGYVRDRLMYHYPAGLLLAARGGHGASDELRRAMASPNVGYTRVNVTLATWYLARDQPEEAVPLLRAALHGSLEASNLYVTHTELHALLARAFSLMRAPDSAAAHRAYVERARVRADPAGRARLDSLVGRYTSPSRL
jgi:tetratricopeptide (TPR) repeat protein